MRLIDYIFFAKTYVIHEKSPKIREIITLQILQSKETSLFDFSY